MALGPRSAGPLATAALAALAACGGSTGPSGDELKGTWSLARVNGDSLPYVYAERVVEGRLIQYRVHEARVEFRTRQRVYDIRTLDFLNTSPDTLIAGYAVEGNRVLFIRGATAAQAAYTDTGSVAGSTLTMRVRHLDGAPDAYATFTYLRDP